MKKTLVLLLVAAMILTPLVGILICAQLDDTGDEDLFLKHSSTED